MEIRKRNLYKRLTVKEIVQVILKIPHDDDAAVYLFFERYEPLLLKQFQLFVGDMSWWEDAMNDFFLYLKGKGDWEKLSSFKWESSLGSWLKTTSRNFFNDFRERVIKKPIIIVNIDEEKPDRPVFQLPSESEEDREKREKRVQIWEAALRLKDEDQRFVMVKKLRGYDSKEVAVMLQMRWAKRGIVKYYKKRIVVPDNHYVDNICKKAKAEIMKMIHQ